jgi:hypothetical protein
MRLNGRIAKFLFEIVCGKNSSLTPPTPAALVGFPLSRKNSASGAIIALSGHGVLG